MQLVLILNNLGNNNQPPQITGEEFGNQYLPKSDANGNLEMLARNSLSAIVNPAHFKIRDEYQHNRGIYIAIGLFAGLRYSAKQF